MPNEIRVISPPEYSETPQDGTEAENPEFTRFRELTRQLVRTPRPAGKEPKE
jgi:hypothetical protein